MVIIDDLLTHLSYCPESGSVLWVKPRCNYVKTGQEAGSISQLGYRKMTFMGKTLSLHRVAWAMYYGLWPSKCIDHINGIRHDNRIINLRDVSLSVNAMNRHVLRRGKFEKLTRGVTAHKSGKWQVQLFCPKANKVKYYGLFEKLCDAEIMAKMLMAERETHDVQRMAK